MAVISRVRVSLTNIPGLPGVMTFYTTDVATFATALHSTLTDLQNYFPSGTHMDIEPTADIIDEATGQLQGQEAVTPGTSLLAFGSGVYAAPAGICLEWHSTTVLDGHRMRGRTFVVPLAGAHLASDGTVLDASLVTLRAIAAALVSSSAGKMVLWHRPLFGPRPTGGGARPLLRNGASAVCTSSSVRDKIMVLRSRRD